MKKVEAERAIRKLCHDWAESSGSDRAGASPSFIKFKLWLSDEGYSHYLQFRSVAGPAYDAEQWFDQEFGQTWRN